MKTVRVKVYKFSELSKPAKEKAIEHYRNQDTEIFWADENRQSMEDFAELFPIKVTNWSYGGRGEGVDFHFTADHDEIEELTGIRLAKYLWNNYKDQIYSRKYYSGLNSRDEKISHNRVKSTQITNNCPNKGKWINFYYSAITIESYNCPLTGYCMDNELLDEVWKFIDKPDTRTFKDLLDDCFHSWIKACNAEIDYQNSDEHISEQLEDNFYQFTKDGKRFNY